MNPEKIKKISKFLSYILRHHPESISLELDKHGWVEVDKLINAANKHGKKIDLKTLRTVVKENDKKRYSFSPDGKFIRASQGHSVEIDLGYRPLAPPKILYHGTARRRLDAIKKHGLQRGTRHHVHLSPDEQTAVTVGSRYGKPAVIKVKAAEMNSHGFEFYLTDNNIWLTFSVPPQYLILP